MLRLTRERTFLNIRLGSGNSVDRQCGFEFPLPTLKLLILSAVCGILSLEVDANDRQVEFAGIVLFRKACR